MAHQRQVASAGLNGPVVDATAEAAPARQPAPQAANADKRELDVFGPAYESVKRLQKGVTDGHLTPEQVIDAVLQGIAIAQSQNMEIPAFELLAQERFADLVDLLIPQATSEFRQECVRALVIGAPPFSYLASTTMAQGMCLRHQDRSLNVDPRTVR